MVGKLPCSGVVNVGLLKVQLALRDTNKIPFGTFLLFVSSFGVNSALNSSTGRDIRNSVTVGIAASAGRALLKNVGW